MALFLPFEPCHRCTCPCKGLVACTRIRYKIDKKSTIWAKVSAAWARYRYKCYLRSCGFPLKDVDFATSCGTHASIYRLLRVPLHGPHGQFQPPHRPTGPSCPAPRLGWRQTSEIRYTLPVQLSETSNLLVRIERSRAGQHCKAAVKMRACGTGTATYLKNGYHVLPQSTPYILSDAGACDEALSPKNVELRCT
jgi:hypothetical protein